VHFLAAHDEPLARLFGEQTGDDTDKLAACQWYRGPDGVPVLDGCRGWVAGDIVSRTDVGDHVAFAVRVTAAESRAEDTPWLGFQRVRSFSPGHPA
jgi:flavin reductase (DIM6/NTAB) family NADH-FMN oxidoreductase RutF